MNLLELTQVLEKEGKIRRSSWNEKCYLTKRGEGLVYFAGHDEVPAYVSWYDLNADDWEVVEEKKPETFGFKQALTYACAGKRCGNLKFNIESYIWVNNDGGVMMYEPDEGNTAITTHADVFNKSTDWYLHPSNFEETVTKESEAKKQKDPETFGFDKVIEHLDEGKKCTCDLLKKIGIIYIYKACTDTIHECAKNGFIQPYTPKIDELKGTWREYKENKSGSGCPNYPD